MGTAYQINDQEATYFMTFQVVGWVERPEHYLYSSARNYSDMDCLIEIVMI